MLNAGCSDKKWKGNEYKENISFNVYDSILSKQTDSSALIAIIDSQYNSIINKSPWDTYNYVKAKTFIYDKIINNKNEAFKYSDILLNISKKYNLRKIESSYLKGQIAYSFAEYRIAFYHYNNAKNEAIRNNDTNTLSNLYYLTGMSLYNQNRFHESIEMFKEAISSRRLKSFENEFRRQECLNNIGLCYDELGETDSSINYYLKAFDDCYTLKAKYTSLTEINSIDEGLAVSKRNLGNAFKLLKQYDSSIIHLTECNNYLKNRKSRIKTTALLSLSQCYLLKSNFKDASRIIDTIDYIHDSTDIDLAELYYTTLLIKDTLTGNVTGAYQIQKKLLSLATKRLKNMQLSYRADLSLGIKNSQNELEVTLLSKDIENKDLKIKVNSIMLFSFILITIILSIVIYLLKIKKEIISSQLDKIKQQKNELEDLYISIQVNDNNKLKLIRSIVHDIINPISSIIAITQLQIAKNNNEDFKMVLEKIERTATSIANMAKDIIIEAKNEKAVLLKEKCNIIDILSYCIEDCKPLATKKNQKIVFANNYQNIEVFVDRLKFERVFVNIISNAIKFSYHNAEIIINVLNQVDAIVISFQDFGIGIPKELEMEVFKSFGSAGRIGTDNEPSNSLGLSIVKEILSLHSGKIWFQSKESIGTTFYISIPKK